MKHFIILLMAVLLLSIGCEKRKPEDPMRSSYSTPIYSTPVRLDTAKDRTYRRTTVPASVNSTAPQSSSPILKTKPVSVPIAHTPIPKKSSSWFSRSRTRHR